MGRRLLILLCLCGSAFAGTTDPAIDDARYLEAGDQHGYVLKLYAENNEGELGCGSAVAISDQWLLTAAHVVHDSRHASVHLGDRTWTVGRVVVHPRFRHAMMGEHDLALLRCDESLGFAAYPLLADGTEAIGDDVVIVGYGATGPLTTGYDTIDGKRRAGTNTICRRDRSLWICHGCAGTSAREILTAPGDSGGAMLVRGRLAGIHSIVMRDGKGHVLSTTGQESGHTRVGDYIGWISETTAGELTTPLPSEHVVDVHH